MPIDALYPVVLFNEDNVGARPIRGRVQNRIGLVGAFSRGPANEGVVLSTREQLRKVFEEDLFPGSLAVQAAMDQGARDFTIVRALSKGRAGRAEILVVGTATSNHIVTILVRDDKGQVAFEATSIAINNGDTEFRIRDKIATAIAQDPNQRVLPEVFNNRLTLTAQEFGYQTNNWTVHVVPLKQFGSGIIDVERLKQVESAKLTNDSTAYVFSTGLYYDYEPSSDADESLPTVIRPNDKQIRATFNTVAPFLPVVINHTTDTITLNNHGFLVGDRIRFGFATAPEIGGNPISSTTIYYVTNVTTNSFQVATSLTNALAGTPVANFDNSGTSVTVRHIEGAYRQNLSELRAFPLIGVEVPFLINLGDGNGVTNTYKWDPDNLTTDNGNDVTTATHIKPDVLTIVNPGRWVKDNLASNGRWIISTPPSVGTTYAPTTPARFTGGQDPPTVAERILYHADNTPILKVLAKSPGVWGNDVAISVTPAQQTFGIIRRVNLRVVDFRRTNQVASGFFEEFLPNLDTRDVFFTEAGNTLLTISNRSDLVNLQYLGKTADDLTKVPTHTKAIGTLSFASDASADGILFLDFRDKRSGFPITNTIQYSYKQFDSAQSIAKGVENLINTSGAKSAATLRFKAGTSISSGQTVTVLGVTTAPAPAGGYNRFTLVDALEAAFVGDLRYDTVVLPTGDGIRFVQKNVGVDTTPINLIKSSATDVVNVDISNNSKILSINSDVHLVSSIVTTRLKLTDGTVLSRPTFALGSLTSPITDVEVVTNAIANAWANNEDVLVSKLNTNTLEFKLLDNSELDIEEITFTVAGFLKEGTDQFGAAWASVWPGTYTLSISGPVNVANGTEINVASTSVTISGNITTPSALASQLAAGLGPTEVINGITYNVSVTGSTITFTPTSGSLTVTTPLVISIGTSPVARLRFLGLPTSTLTVDGGTPSLPVEARLIGLELVIEAKDVGTQGNQIEYRARTNNLLSILVLPTDYERLEGGQDLATEAFLRYGSLGPTLIEKDYLDALEVLKNLQANIIGVAATVDELNRPIETLDSIHFALIQQAETASEEEGMRFAVLAAPKGLTASQCRNYMATQPNSRCGKIVAGWCTYAAQPILGRFAVSPTGFALGHIAVTPFQSSTSARTTSPAIRNVIETDVSVGHSARNEYTQNRMDIIYREEGTGIIHFLNGRTLSTDPAWYWDTIRRVYNVIREELYFGLQWAKSEPITKQTIRQIKDAVDNYMEIKKSEGLILEFSKSNISVANNPVGSLVSGNLVIDTYFTPIYPADRILVNLIRQPERVVVVL